MRAHVLAFLVVLGLALPGLVAATPVPEEVYRVIAASTQYGGGYGWLWGHPDLGARLWLDTTGGYGEFGFTIGGQQTYTSTTIGTFVLDRWTGPNNDRFVGGYFQEDGAEPVDNYANYVAFGGGKLNTFEIVVIGHS